MPNNKPSNLEENVPRGLFLFHMGQLIIYLFFVLLLLSTIGFFVGISITPFHLPIAMIVSIALLIAFYDSRPGKQLFFECCAVIAIMVFFSIAAGKVYDLSYDGNCYHKLAAGFIRNGWNPITTKPDGAYTETMIGQADTEVSLWLECYPKMTWIFTAALYAITNNIEMAKIHIILSMFAAFCLTADSITLSKGKKWAFALIAALNPVAVAQMDTFYQDGFLHMTLYIFVLSQISMRLENSKISRRTMATIGFASFTALANTKYTGLFYGVVFCACFFLLDILNAFGRFKNSERKAFLLKRTGYYVALAFSSVVFGGATSYITNILHYRNPVYTLIGNGAVDIMTVNSPFPMGSDRIRNLFLSLFSKIGSVYNGSYSIDLLRMPYAIDWGAERQMLSYPDLRLSGFGILFGGLFLATSLLGLYFYYTCPKTEEKQLLRASGLACIILTFCIEQSWWARYAPYVYIWFLLCLYCVFKFIDERYIAGLLIVFSVMNSLAFTLDFPNEMQETKQIETELNRLGSSQESIMFDYTIAGGYFPGMCYNLMDNCIHYTINLTLEEEEATLPFYNGMTLYKSNRD